MSMDIVHLIYAHKRSIASEQQHSDTKSALLPGYEDNHADKTKINVTNYLFQIVIETTAFQGRGLQ